MSETVVFSLEADSASPGAARAHLHGFLLDNDACDAAVVLSELVTNAVVHGLPPLQLRLSRTRLCVRIEVRDTGPGVDAISPRTVGVHDQQGRGLRIVAARSDTWGVTADGESKIVWAELPI